MKKFVFLGLVLTLTASAMTAFADTKIESNNKIYNFVDDTYEKMSNENIEKVLNQDNENNDVLLIGEESQYPVVEVNGQTYYFVSDEFKGYTEDELLDIAKSPRSRAAANLSSKSCKNNSTVSWGTYTTNASAALLWTPKSSKSTTANMSCTNTDFSKTNETIGTSGNATYVFLNTKNGSHTLSLKNTGAATVTFSGTFDIQYQ